MFETGYKINEKVALFDPKITKISENSFISVQLYKKGEKVHYEVNFNNDGKDYYIGKFINLEIPTVFFALYKNGKVLICHKVFNEKTEKMEVARVEALYSVLDDCLYSCTEEEAIELFDNNISTKYLRNGQRNIQNCDLERIKSRKK